MLAGVVLAGAVLAGAVLAGAGWLALCCAAHFGILGWSVRCWRQDENVIPVVKLLVSGKIMLPVDSHYRPREVGAGPVKLDGHSFRRGESEDGPRRVGAGHGR